MRIVVTGGTSGIGREAVERLAAQGGHSILVGARDPRSAHLPQEVEVYPLDLASFASVRSFADHAASGPPIDALVLNAGLQLAGDNPPVEGMERTFAVNHLAHYLLLRLLADRLADEGRVVLTSSGTHDPAEKTPVRPPDHAEAELLAFPDKDPQAPKPGSRSFNARAYSSSKLCNAMTAREFARRYPGHPAMAFDPGFIPETGLARDYPKWLTRIVLPLMKAVVAKDRKSTIPVSGGFLAALASDPAYARSFGDYWSVRGNELNNLPPSELARDDAAAAKLWDDSARLVGLSIS